MHDFVDGPPFPADPYQIDAMASRCAPAVRMLKSYSFPSVVGAIAGLLTRAENHSATTRLEAMVHLAAVGCRGTKAPSVRRLRQWLNVTIYNDVITHHEDPVEDVAVSNVITPVGNVRLFAGNWNDIAYGVQDFFGALSKLDTLPWTANARKQVVALLKISERVAARAEVPRNAMALGSAQRPVEITHAIVEDGRACVTFSEEDLREMGIAIDDLEPFIFSSERDSQLLTEHLKHSSLQRRPLIRVHNRVVVVLPTAIGPAVVRYVIECAFQANDMEALQTAVIQEQGSAGWGPGIRAWAITDADPPPFPRFSPRFLDAVGNFDRDSPVHVIYVPDELEGIASDGLHSWHSIDGDVTERVERIWKKLSARPGYRRGLTIVVHGGAGRGFHSELSQTPVGWHLLALPLADFTLLAWDGELTALRAWKFLDQEQRLAERGLMIQNLSGFPNLYAFLRDNDFMILPYDCDLQTDLMALPTDSIASLRRFLRVRLDSHGVLAPHGNPWLPVQRMNTQRDLLGDHPSPIYGYPMDAAAGHLAACVESSGHVWWMTCDARSRASWHHNLVYMVWKMALHWLVPLASLLKKRLRFDATRPIVYRLSFPRIEDFSPREDSSGGIESPPVVHIKPGHISISCPPQYLRVIANGDNVGEEMMVAAMLRGAYLLAGSPPLSSADIATTVQAIMGSSAAQHFAMFSSSTPAESIYATVALPPPRFPSQEDRAWSTIGLAQVAGWSGTDGLINRSSAEPLMERSVNALWKRIRSRLRRLDRQSVLQRSLLNVAAVQKDRMEWRRFSSAILAMADDEQAIRQAADTREAQRALAALASRVIAEMALCTSPTRNGKPCTDRDLDVLLGQVATLLACAVQKDAMHFGLLTEGVMVHANGSFGFDPSIQNSVYPYASRLRERQIWDAHDGKSTPRSSLNDETGQAAFDSAFGAEFGLSVTQYLRFIELVTDRLVQRRDAYIWVRRTEVIHMLKRVGAEDPAGAFAALVLLPRDKWDEENPGSGCKSRDWYPWRYGRRLSVLRRPFVQLSREDDSDVLLMPTLLETAAGHLLEARTGQLTKTLFDSQEMRSWIGTITNQLGHAFNETVAAKLRNLGWQARAEVRMTELGGGADLGDVDVLAWHTETGSVYAIECKRLMYDRTVGEIGRRLRDYTDSNSDGERTPIQKTLDRMTFLRNNTGVLEQFIGLRVGKGRIRSALVTDDITPMQFSQHVRERLDLVVDYGGLTDHFAADK